MTFRKYFNFFPEPIRTQLINNTESYVLDLETDNPEEVIHDAFMWEGTPEGYEYWSDLDERINEFINF